MSLEENHKQIDDEYINHVVKLKNAMALKRDSEILCKLGLEYVPVCAFNLALVVLWILFDKNLNWLKSCCISSLMIILHFIALIMHSTIN